MPRRGISCQATRAKRQVSQNRQLLRRIAAVDVHRWIGLGKSKFLRLGHGVGVACAQGFHLRENVIAGAVQNGMDRLDLIGRQTRADVGDDRDAAADRRLERDRTPKPARPVEQFGPMLGQQGLVGRDHILATLEQLERVGSGRLQAADQQRHDRISRGRT